MGVYSDPLKRRWLGWGTLAAAFVLVSFHRVSTGVIAEDLMGAFDATGTELGLLHASFFYIYAVMQLPSGVLADQFGTRRIGTVGALVMAAGTVGFALSGSFGPAFLARALIGLGGSVMFVTALRFVSNWYRASELGTMTGLTAGSAGVGGILATTPLAIAVGAWGWQTTLAGVGVLGLVLVVAIHLTAHTRPAAAGLPEIEGVEGAPRMSWEKVVSSTKTVFGEFETWLLGMLMLFTSATAFTVLGLWGVPYIVQIYDVSVATASAYVLVGNVGLTAGAPALGWISDRIGRRIEVMMAGSVVYTLGYGFFVAFASPPLWSVGVVLFVTIFVSGGFLLSFTVITERHPDASGVGVGAVNTIAYVGAAVFPAVMGAVLDAFWTGETVSGARVYTSLGYRVAFGIAAATGVLMFVCTVWLYRRERRQSP